MKRVYLWHPGKSENDPELIREASNALSKYFCNGLIGRTMGDPVFERVTERRQTINAQAKKNNPNVFTYSACGDKEHAILYCLGCRDETLVNRNSDGGKTPWVSGVNISRITRHPAFIHAQGKVTPKRGDIFCLMGTKPQTEHVANAEFFDLDMGKAVSWDYGQFLRGTHGGKQVIRVLSYRNGQYWLAASGSEDKYLVGWLDITKIPLTESAIVPDDFPYGILDDSPYHEDQLDWESLPGLKGRGDKGGLGFCAACRATSEERNPGGVGGISLDLWRNPA